MKKNLGLLALCQGLYLTNNVTFIAINGLVGLALAPRAWMATVPVMGYVVGGALSTSVVATTQQRFGRKVSFQLGLLVALVSALLCAWAMSVSGKAINSPFSGCFGRVCFSRSRKASQPARSTVALESCVV